MNPRLLLRSTLLGLLVLAGCSADQTGLVILSARAPGLTCAFDDDSLYVSGGSIDLTPYDLGGGVIAQTNTFYQVFSWENNLAPAPLIVNGQTIDPGTGNNFIADQVLYTYQYSAAGQTFEPEVANIRAVINAGGTTLDNSIGINLIQPKAAAKLLTIADATRQTLLVTFQVTGKVTAGNTLSSNEVSFPITIYKNSNTPVVCPTGQVLATDCGSVGRNSDVHCETPAP